MTALRLDWHSIFVNKVVTLEDILDQYTDVFKDELGLLKGSTAKIYKEADATPCFFNARSVPYALCKKVEDELNRLQDLKIIEPVQFSDWAAPIVPVLKNDGTIRICGDYKITINKAAKLDKYPVPPNREFICETRWWQIIH